MSNGEVPKSAAETAWHERRKAVMERTGADGTVLVRGTTTDPPHTEETMAGVRLMMITQERDDALKHAFAFVCCEDSDADSDDSNCARFYNTAAGNEVVFGIKDEVKKATSSKLTKPQKFDRLCMLTYALLQEDTWSRDNECWGEGGRDAVRVQETRGVVEEAPRRKRRRGPRRGRGIHRARGTRCWRTSGVLNDASSDSGVKYRSSGGRERGRPRERAMHDVIGGVCERAGESLVRFRVRTDTRERYVRWALVLMH